ncbi:MAG TPA: polysaccharide biosynthesis tyrosine autokinase [Bryobacteraceae bacterium]|nr:polysaccharide biosynthesis tyrosine autokinase [Bryobacteraceae bacterium]
MKANDMTEPRALPAPNQALQPSWSGYDMEPQEQSAVPLAHYLWILRRHRWKILAFVFACVTATFIVSARLTPIYESTVTVDIDRQIPSAIIGQDAARAPLNDADQFLATQVKLIQSDSVLRPVAQQYHLLDLEKESSDVTPEKSSEAEEDAPILLKKLKVTRPPNTYLLLISYRSPQPRLAAGVANAVARSYVEHTYNIRFQSSASLADFMEKQLEELKAKMEHSSAALAQFERELNVINPEEKTSILSARLLQLNTEYTNAQTDRVRKESAWKSVQSGSLEAAQVSTQGDNLKTLSAKLDEARQRFADTKTHYGPNHPEYRKAAVQVEEIERQLQESSKNAAQRVEVEYHESMNRESMLQKAVSETKAEFDRLNARSFDYQNLKREAEADKSLYEELVRKIKEAGINAGFQNSSIRIADPARAAIRPVFPNMKLNVLLAFLFSTLVAVGFAVLTDLLDSSVRDPEQVHTLFQTDVLGSLPMVRTWRRGFVSAMAGEAGSTALVHASEETAAAAPDRTVTGFEEAVRTLRNSILLGSFDRRLRSLMITSATPSEGKTTTAVHLAIAHAQQKHKTLLIDCDLRRPGVHSKLGINPEAGLAAVLQNGMQWREKLVKLPDLADLDILPTGFSSRRAADLIGRRLPEILEEAANEYDLIVVDSPPILGFPEPLQMAAAVDGVVMVAKAGETNRKTVGSALSTLQRVRANVVGLVLNSVTSNMSDSYRYYGYYGKYYRYYKSPE